MKVLLRLVIVCAVFVALMQLVRPKIPAAPATAEIEAPPQVREILDRRCYSCHSNERRLSWFDEIEPGYWLVRKDILTARGHLDFSTIGSLRRLSKGIIEIQRAPFLLPPWMRSVQVVCSTRQLEGAPVMAKTGDQK
jgi:hypothetical protein